MRRRIEQATKGVVLSGPFKGMRFLSKAWGTYYPKLLGTYELELQPWVAEILESEFDRVIIIGAAEGYYAVGLAWRRRDWAICAFEAHEQARACLADLAHLNGVEDRITIRGLCDVPALSNALTTAVRPFVLMDVEGAESVLLDPRVIPALAVAHILVELHEFALPGIGEIMSDRFGDTHTIASASQAPRQPSDFPIPVSGLDAAYLQGAAVQFMSEFRADGENWLLMLPRGSPAVAMPKDSDSDAGP